MTGLSDGTAIAPSCSVSSFFQLVNSCLKVGSALPADSNGPPTAATRDGRQAELLQLCGSGLIANVQRAGDEGGLGQLGLLDAGKRPVGCAATDRGGGNRRFVDLLAGDDRFDQRLALLELAGAGFGCVDERNGGRAGEDDAGGGVAGPGDHGHQDEEESGLEMG